MSGGAALAKDASTTLSVTGWHCGGCSSKTEAAFRKVKGVKKVEADADKNTVTVAYDDGQTTLKALQDAIKSVGFESKPVKN